MVNVNIFYVKGIRKSEYIPKPDDRIRRAVNKINKLYNKVGLDIKLNLIDIDIYLNKLNNENLSSIVEANLPRNELIRKIQESISFEEAKEKEGIYFDEGEWYKDGELLKPLQFENLVTIDYFNFRFMKRFNIREIVKKVYKTELESLYKIHSIVLGRNKEVKEEDIIKRINEDYQSLLTEIIQEFKNIIPCENNINRLEDEVNKTLNKAYLESDLDLFKIVLNVLSSRKYPSLWDLNISLEDICALYVNSLKDLNERKIEFERFLYLIKRGFKKMESDNSYIRITPAPGYEREVGFYPYMERLYNFIKLNQQENGAFILLDKYLPNFKISNIEVKIYMFFRHHNLSYMGSAGNINTLNKESVQFLLLHELAHQIAHTDDIESETFEETFDTPLDTRLMLAPVHYRSFLNPNVIPFNLRKLSEESISEAYYQFKGDT